MSQNPTDDFAAPEDIPPIAPNPSAAKTIGILNIVFASALLLAGLCCGTYAVVFSNSGFWSAQQQQMQAAIEGQRKAEIKKLEDEEKDAKTDKEKGEIRARLRQLELQQIPEINPVKMYGMDDSRVVGYWIGDAASGLIVNLAMLIAGIGLVALKDWGRLLGIWVAVIKIVRLVVVYGFYILVVVPIITQRFIETTEKTTQAMGAQVNAAGPQMRQAAVQAGEVTGIMMTIWGASMIVFGAIYPVTCAIVLTRARVKAACRMSPEEREELL
jgi:hypothetical protein